jgi:DNA-directed RNA polymerase subunit E'/Rpb7
MNEVFEQRFITFLESEVRMQPSLLNSNLLTNIKRKLIERYKGMNFGKYGLVEEIYSIDQNIGDGKMRAADSSASVYYTVRFKTKLYKPIVGTITVAKIDSVSKETSIMIDGPTVFIIEGDKINTNRFKYKGALYYINNNGEESKTPLQKGDYVLLRIINVSISPNESEIMALAYLEDIPTKEQITRHINFENDSTIAETPLSDIIEKSNEKTVDDDESESESELNLDELSLSGSDLETESNSPISNKKKSVVNSKIKLSNSDSDLSEISENS